MLDALTMELYNSLKHAVKIIEEHVDPDVLGSDMMGDPEESHLQMHWPILDEHLHYMKASLNKVEVLNDKSTKINVSA